jgi:hypothetical protein
MYFAEAAVRAGHGDGTALSVFGGPVPTINSYILQQIYRMPG